PVKQFRMTRRLSLGTKIETSLYEPGAEQLLPQAIHCHAGGQRMFRRNNPLGEIESRETCVGLRLFNRCEGSWYRRFDFLTRFVVLATHHHKRISRLIEFAKDESARCRFLRDDFRRSCRLPRSPCGGKFF